MFKNLITLSLLAIVIFSVSSCKKKHDDPKPSDNNSNNGNNVELSFLKEGATFKHHFDNLFEDTITIVIEKKLAQDTFLVRYVTDLDIISPTVYWVLKNNTLYSSYRLRDPDGYQAECKFGEPVGTSWQVKKGNYLYVYTIDSLNATVVTGAGKFTDAVKIKIQSATSSQASYFYYSPTAGLLGDGKAGTQNLLEFKPGTDVSAPAQLPAITYGNFPFLKTGNYWKYSESAFSMEDDSVLVMIESKVSGKNIYKVKLKYDSSSDAEYEYWYEDNGLLMVYEEGESLLKADPIYSSTAKSKVGHGWTGFTSSGTAFIYKITSLNEPVDTYYGPLQATAISVTSGFFSAQTNYWTENKGNVLVSGLVERNIGKSNVRMSDSSIINPLVVF
jgi:hypothetical protein